MAWYLQNMPECLPCIGSSKRWDFGSIRSFQTPPTAPPRKTLPGIISSNSSCKHWTLPNVSEDRKRTILLLFILLVIPVNQRIQEVIIILTHIATAASGGWGSRGGRRSFLLLLFCTKILSNEMEVQLFVLCCSTSDLVLCSSISICAGNPLQSDNTGCPEVHAWHTTLSDNTGCPRGARPFLMGNCMMMLNGEIFLSSNLLLPLPLLRFSIKSTHLVQLRCTFFLFSLNLNSYVCFYVGSVCTGLLS